MSVILAHELLFYDHHYEYHETTDDYLNIPLKGNELIRDISVKIINGATNKVTIDDRPLTKTSDPFYTHYVNKCVRKNNISYIFSSTLAGRIDGNEILTGHLQGKQTKNIVVCNSTKKGEKLKLLLVIKYDNFIGNNGTMYFKYGFEAADISNSSSYPLTKISEDEYVEGYWISKTRKYITPTSEQKYPFPKEGTIDVDNEFLTKLDAIIKSSISDSNLTNNEFQKNTVYITDISAFLHVDYVSIQMVAMNILRSITMEFVSDFHQVCRTITKNIK